MKTPFTVIIIISLRKCSFLATSKSEMSLLTSKSERPKKLSVILIKNVRIIAKNLGLEKVLKRSLRIIYKKEYCSFSNFVSMGTFNAHITKNNIFQFQSISARATSKMFNFQFLPYYCCRRSVNFFSHVSYTKSQLRRKTPKFFENKKHLIKYFNKHQYSVEYHANF